MLVHPTSLLRSALAVRSALSPYHPLLIEGHTRDARDPAIVATQIVANLRQNWEERNVTKPPILISQGDPLTEKGISAITRLVAEAMGVKRCLICLDADIDPEHAQLADRHEVVYELRYSQLVEILDNATTTCTDDEIGDHMPSKKLTEAIDNRIAAMNEKRRALGKDELADWYRKYALLQEVTKSAFKTIAGEVSVAHATDDIAEFSVTSFYEVGLELGLIGDTDMICFSDAASGTEGTQQQKHNNIE